MADPVSCCLKFESMYFNFDYCSQEVKVKDHLLVCIMYLWYLWSIFQDNVNDDTFMDYDTTDADFEADESNDDEEGGKYNTQAFLQAIECGLRYGLTYNQICAMINRYCPTLLHKVSFTRWRLDDFT